jgi:hypothetical protein
MNIFVLLVLYTLGIALVGIFIFKDEIGPSFLITKKDRKLGPSYWGVYQGSPLEDALHEQTVKPPEPCKDVEGAVGSGAYAGGKAVSSAKS